MSELKPGIYVVDAGGVTDVDRWFSVGSWGRYHDARCVVRPIAGPFTPSQIAAIPEFCKSLERIRSICGLPDAAEACRLVIAEAGKALAKLEGKR